MSISAELGEPRAVQIPAGTIEYRERGGGPPIVLVHGVGVNGDLWRWVVPELADRHRCITPDLPLGAHALPLREGVDMSLPELARILADFLAALNLHDVAIVANDTGGAIAPWLAGHPPQRARALRLTPWRAVDRLPPRPPRDPPHPEPVAAEPP